MKIKIIVVSFYKIKKKYKILLIDCIVKENDNHFAIQIYNLLNVHNLLIVFILFLNRDY